MRGAELSPEQAVRESASSSARPAVTGAEALVAQLGSFGVEVAFGLCGHTNIALLDAIGRSRIRFVMARHEQAAAHAADGYARESGKTGVVIVHVGPGLTNAVTGVATAALDSVPLVVIAGDVPSYYRGRGPHQEVNLHHDAAQSQIYAPFAKRVWDVNRAQDLPRFAERAFWTASSGRPGAVLLNVPMDMFSRPVRSDLALPSLPAEVAAPALEHDAANRIAHALLTAEQPVVYVGGGLRSTAARAAVGALAEHLDIPIVHSLMAKGAIPDSHPLLLGMPGFWGVGMTNEWARKADVVLTLGSRFAETDASSWDDRFTWRIPPARLFQVDVDPAEIGRNYPVELGAVADLAQAAAAIEAAVRAKQPEPVTRPRLRDQIRNARSELWARARHEGSDDAFPLRPQRVLADLLAVLPRTTALVTDVGWNKNGVAQCYQLPDEGRFITPGGLSTMGFAPAAALGVQLASPGRTVVALVGDGGMSAQLSAVPTAVEQGLPVLFVVMNNRAHGTIADLERSHYGSAFGTEFTGPDGHAYSPDFAAYGRACGADGYSVTSAADLRPALLSALAAHRPSVIDVPMVNEPVPTPGYWNINDIYRSQFD